MPTWNYAAVHAYGRLRPLERREDKLDALRRLVGAHDPAYLERMERLPPDYLALKLDGTVDGTAGLIDSMNSIVKPS